MVESNEIVVWGHDDSIANYNDVSLGQRSVVKLQIPSELAHPAENQIL